jgi:glycosyltransferase involved in cell wall biosynthesis
MEIIVKNMRVNSNYNNFVSVVIITYDPTALHVQKTLKVLLKQSYKNFELILVDSGKKRLSASVLTTTLQGTTLPHKVIYYHQKEGARFNFSHAYNMGIRQAKGDIIVRISGDAIPVGTHWLQHCVNLLNLDHVGLVSGMDIITNQLTLDTYLLSALYDRVRHMSFQAKKRSVFKNMPLVNGPCMIFWRAIWEENKFNEECLWGEEIEFAAWAMRREYYLLCDPDIKILHSHRLETKAALRRIGSDLLFAYKTNKIFQEQFLRSMQSLLKMSIEVPFAQIEKGRQYYIRNGSQKKMRAYLKQLAIFTRTIDKLLP